MISDIDTRDPSLGIEMLDAYMGKGYAQAAVKLLISYAFKQYPIDKLLWKATNKNMAGRHIAKKEVKSNRNYKISEPIVLTISTQWATITQKQTYKYQMRRC